LTIDNKSNGTYYNHPGVLASEIIAGNAPQPPETAREFMAKLDTILGVGAVAASNSPSSANAVPSTVSSTTGSPTPATSALEPIPGKLTTHPMEDPNPGKEPPQ
jgi:hypothetical protein